MIAPSRPGYGRSSPAKNYEEVADKLAALLDAIGIEQVAAVHCMSGGGPPAIMFAVRHPQKTKILLTECKVTGGYAHLMVELTRQWYTKMAMQSITLARLTRTVGMETLCSNLLKAESTNTAE